MLLYRDTQNFSDTLWSMGGFLKRILTYLYCTQYKETNMRHLDKEKFVSYKNDINSIIVS